MCLCPKGRKYTSFNAKWELTLCRSCGSQGIHMACGQLKWAKPVWECSECISILDKSEETTNANTSVITLQSNDFNSENSDSDISVGKESPIPFMTNIPSPILMQDVPTIKLRPGPRTFKLRQQMQIAKEQEMQNRISKQQSTEEEDTTSKLPCAEECTSNKNTLKSRSDICEEYINSTTEHSESVTAALNDTIIMLDSDDDRTKNKTTSSLESTILIADVSETAATNLFELKSSAVEDEKSDTVHDFSLFQTLKLETSNLDENYKNNSSTDNFKSAENVDLEENKSIALDEIIHLNPASDYDSRDMLSNIKISNVMSLTPEEFENVSFIMAEREADCTECPSQICSPRPHSSMSKSDHFEEVRFKRKVDNDTLSSTNALEVNHKKMRRSLDILYEQEKQRRHVHISTKNSRKPVASVNSTLPSIEINKDNKDSTSGNVLKIHDSVTKTAATINQTSNADHSIEANTYETLDNDVGSTSSECKKQGNNNRTTMNQAETIFEDKMIKGHRRSCDADAGTSPAVTRSGYRDITRDSRIDPTRECVSHVSLQSGTSEQLERQSGLQMATISHCKTSVGGINQTSNERDHYRLIPEYIRLRDLKFRVCSSNNLQMILYNKFSVNINMENATAVRKTTKFDVSPRKSVQQKYLKTHTESPSVFMTESILCSSTPICKDKVRHSLPVIDRSENYRDDAKENLDPISCKNLADNSNNLSEESGSMHFPYNLSKAIEEDNKRLHRETVNSVTDIVNTFDADELIARSNDIQFKNISSVKQNVRRNGTAEYIKKDDPFDSKSICVNSIFENKKNATGSNFKISIDLKKIESFIHTNPELFSKSRKINDERSIDEVGFLKEWNDMSEISNIASRHVTDSVIDESMHLGNFTISLTGNRLTELKSHAEESKESDNEVVSTNNLVTETRYFNKPSFNRSKHDVKWTGSHFEKRCFFNR
ncbi:G2/M phase-specific E3 ubiquitin-protein ligase [Dufourea novaeangliae]|uniref:G2/M phase-specific E3 ubiquitin-protein ligase n=2 Tax=Dufourea novaeangliae TaxID=178035 RepID=A0A154PH38_DUFNO|nr:G2/M phase-specific E3 ubiquitin-protein ligase [Dufourea novaeangliae]